MNRTKSLVFFFIFLLCFLFTQAFKFQRLILDRDQSTLNYIFIFLGILISSFVLSFSIRALSPTKRRLIANFQSFAWVIAAFFSVSLSEEIMSQQSYLKSPTPERFSSLSGHCGVYSGWTVLKLIHSQQFTERNGAIKEFLIKEKCRLKHLDFLNEQKAFSICKSEEDAIDCQIRWMTGIAEHGSWSLLTRKYFFNKIQQVWLSSKKEESLVAYLLKDQELESGRQSILRQSGFDELLSGQSLYLQEKEEFENLILTRDIFSALGPMVVDAPENPQPYLFKFKDAQTEVEAKIAKIPELSKEIETLEANAKIAN